MRLAILFAFSALLAAPPAGAQGPRLTGYAPPDTSLLLGIDLKGMRESTFGQTLLAQVESDANLKPALAMIGFNPLRDIDEILLAATVTNKKPHGIALIRCRIDPQLLRSHLATSGAQPETYRGVEILTRPDANPMSLAWLDKTLLIAGDSERVRAAIRDGASASPPAALASRVAELDAMHLWFISRVSPAEFGPETSPTAPGPQMQAELLKSIVEISGGIRLAEDVTISLEAVMRTPKDAEGLAALLRMGIGLAASDRRSPREAAAILEKLQLRAEGNSLKLSLAIPQAELANIIKAAAQQQAQKPKPPSEVTVEAAPQQPQGVTVHSSPSDMGVVTLPPPK
ncbi:MAG: hypothetical protein ABSD27_05750 [Bryobacteraceae bacterium]|jgi:hypothetical protein